LAVATRTGIEDVAVRRLFDAVLMDIAMDDINSTCIEC
jgi:hypothetical protein